MFKSTSTLTGDSRANNCSEDQKSWSPTTGIPIVEMATVESKESKSLKRQKCLPGPYPLIKSFPKRVISTI